MVFWLLEVNQWIWSPVIYYFVYALPAIYVLRRMKGSINYNGVITE